MFAPVLPSRYLVLTRQVSLFLHVFSAGMVPFVMEACFVSPLCFPLLQTNKYLGSYVHPGSGSYYYVHTQVLGGGVASD